MATKRHQSDHVARDQLAVARHEVMHGIRNYSEEDQDDLLWLYGYAVDVLRGSRGDLLRLTGYDYTVITRIWHGTYTADIASFMEIVRKLRTSLDVTRGTEFVETLVTRKVFKTLDYARDFGGCVHICGPAGRSKTHAVREWARANNHGRAIYFEVPPLGGARALLEELAAYCRIGRNRKSPEIVSRLKGSLDRRNILLIDEAVRLLPNGRGRNVTSLEFLRSLHDQSGVALAFVSTDVFRQEVENGAISGYLEQLVGRIDEILMIPQRVCRQEAAEICRAFNPGAAPEFVALAHRIANPELSTDQSMAFKGRVRLLFKLMRQAELVAKKAGEPVDERHLKAALAYRKNLHTWPED